MKTADAKKSYQNLKGMGLTGAHLRSIVYLLDLDQETCMPSAGIGYRADLRKLVSELRHKQMTSKKLKSALESLCSLDGEGKYAEQLTDEQKASVREFRRDYLRDNKLTASFIRKMSDATTHALDAWKIAKQNNHFRTFAPHLKEIVKLSQKKAELIGYKEHPYDALLDEYEPGTTVSFIDKVFSELREKLIFIVNKRKTMKSNQIDTSFFTKSHFPLSHQKELCTQIVKQMGLPQENFNLSETAHPFCSALCPQDIRLTTHYDMSDFRKAYFAAIHEAGHGLYEHNLPMEHLGTPLAEAASHAIHESQSRFWECFIGHSPAFWRNQYPKVKELFPGAFDSISLDHFVQSINTVNPSLIRIHSDEVTYGLHVILRYEIEKGLIDGSIQVKDIPKLWNTMMKEMVGVAPPSDKEGCLQDIHWSLGAIGYFPSYALGNLYAGALFVHMIKTHTNWEQKAASGDFIFIKDYLKDKIHRHGRRYTPIELIEKATAKKFSSADYISYLETKYVS